MNKIKIVTLAPKDWEKYKDIRLDMLLQEQKAFHTKFEDEATRPQDFWEEKLVNENLLFAFAECDGKIVGVMNLEFGEEGEPVDVAVLHGAYVKATYRGMGVGKQLLEFLINEAEKRTDIKTIKLWVKEYQTSAVVLYIKSGFKFVTKVGDHTLIMERKFE